MVNSFVESYINKFKVDRAGLLVEEGLIPFLANAVNPKPSEKMKILSEVSATKLARFKTDDLDTTNVKQTTYREVSRCIGNLSFTASPELSQQIIEEGALQILDQIFNIARSADIIRNIARSIANFSAHLNPDAKAIIDGGWVGILEHWISAECQRAITFKAKMPATELLTKDAILKGASFQSIEMESEERKLTEIALAALGNLTLANRSVAEDIARTNLLREVMDFLNSKPTLNIRIQMSRLIANLAAHNNSMIKNRIQTLVGIDGMMTILGTDSNGSTQYNVARCLGYLVEQRWFLLIHRFS